MIIVCDSCGARFHLADGRVGPRGAKVRCSNCHHSFQVAPPEKSGTAASEREDSRQANARRAKSAAAPERRARREVGDPDLDNPEFLFDDGEGDQSSTKTIPGDVPFARKGADVTQKHDPLGETDECDATPAGKRAPTPLMGVDPEVSARKDQLDRETERAAASLRGEEGSSEDRSLFDFGRDEDFEKTPIPGREPSLAARDSQDGSPAPDPGSEADTLDRLSGEGLDEAIARWDAPVPNPRPRRAEPASSGRRVEVLRTPNSGSTVPAPSVALELQRGPSAEPRASSETDASPVWMQVLASLVGLALIASGARASLRQLQPPRIEGARVQALGWSIDQVRAAPARDAAGDPAIEVAGSLLGPPGARLPSVWVTPLDGGERPVGAAVRARLASREFSALLGEPSASAQSFRIEIAPPEPHGLPEATTAAAPPPAPGTDDAALQQPAAPAPTPAPAAPAP